MVNIVKSNFQTTAIVNNAVSSSTAGSCRRIFLSQLRHLPFSITKLIIGILSSAQIGFEHFGQYDRGREIAIFCGIL
jgi:hypothetical protein